jgi:GAF domain-containing protein
MALSISARSALGDERRRYPRQPVIGYALVPVSIGPGEGSGLMLDISAAGTSIQAFAHLKSGSKKGLRWKFPLDDNWIEVTGQIVWSGADDLAGVRFLEIPHKAQIRIDLALHHFAAASGTPDSLQSPHTRLSTTPFMPQREASLEAFLQRSRAVTRADGIAIALNSGNQFVCRATTGLAPPIGIAVSTKEGLSAECVRTGKIVCCRDVKDDPRVNPDIRTHSIVRSVIAVPMECSGQIVGGVTCVWTIPSAYNQNDIMELKALAQDAVALLFPPFDT